MAKSKGCGSAQAAANGRKGKQAFEVRKTAGYAYGIDTSNLTAEIAPLPEIPRLKLRGGRPYYRPGSLDPWPEMKAALIGERHE